MIQPAIPFEEMELLVCAVCGKATRRGRWVRVPAHYGKWWEDEFRCARCHRWGEVE